ncbi:5'-deoxynucleotidase HDDC2 isoform X2 [Rhodamnia argentea]|uniref:5'-deoxynucleotidase n=1 Tax=Rhodamnia argentea TaxID=178133 RepID=A0A8B8NMC7_9MYRT|nr:5'-deoxynucleotidase HDDC2 isoform X2 [Rhodamnia argentea]
MGSGSRAFFLCKPPSLATLIPSLAAAHRLRFSFIPLGGPHPPSPSAPAPRRMATEVAASLPGDAASSPVVEKQTASASSSSPSPSPSSASSAIDFLTLCHRLKTTKRAGWVRRDVKDPESVADHMYRMGLMALIASDIPGVDRNKCIKMAIVHDIAEAIVGDITPSDGISKVEKSRREREALDHMCRLLGGESQAKEINELWMEYEANLSPEAKVVKDFDKVEMILQALEYENGKFQTELGKGWASEIASRRKGQ